MLAGDETGCRADFMVVKGDGHTLLGRGTAMDLDILRVCPVQANSVSGGLVSDIRGRYMYSALFNRVELLKGYQLKLHIDDSVKPVAQHVRRIPFGLREKVDRKLDELLELDIIEGRRGGLVVSVLDTGSSGPGSGPGRGHCVVFLGKTLYSHGASLHPGV